MYGPHHEPKPIEKIRKAQWSPENTARTQAIVNELHAARLILVKLTGTNSEVAHLMKRAIRRFHDLDPSVVLPSWDY